MNCLECGGRLELDARHAELVCSTCGSVTPGEAEPTLDKLPRGQESEFSPRGLPKRLGSRIHRESRDSHGKPMTAEGRLIAYKLTRTQKIADSGDRKERRIHRSVGRVAEALRLLGASPDLLGDARTLQSKVGGDGFTTVSGARVRAGALAVIVVRQRGSPLPMAEAAERLDVEFKKLMRAVKFIQRCVPDVRTALDVPAVARQLAIRLGRPDCAEAAAAIAAANQLPNENPLAIAAAACKASFRSASAAGDHVGMLRVVRLSGVSEGAIRRILSLWGPGAIHA